MEHILDIDSDRDLKAIMTELVLALTQYYEQQWHEKLQRQESIRGSGQNKLRTYRQFKLSPQSEQYLKIVMPKKYRSAMAKMRAGVGPIRIETGRYKRPALTPEQRICHFCTLNEPETEEHVITRCSQYNGIRNALCQSALNIDIDFMFLIDTENMCFILSEPELAYLSAKAMFEILHR